MNLGQILIDAWVEVNFKDTPKETFKQGIILKVEEKFIPAHTIKVTRYEETHIQCIGFSLNNQNGCKEWLPIKDLEYIQTHWYTPPYSCTSGDLWNKGEGKFICPKCNTTNRLYNREEVEALRPYFKGIIKTYDR